MAGLSRLCCPTAALLFVILAVIVYCTIIMSGRAAG